MKDFKEKPGEYPFTRGIHKTMYTERLWTMRQFAGFGLAEDTNKRFKKLWAAGETGFSTAFDNPTLYGYDSDHPLSLGEVGRGGVAIDNIEDMSRLFRGIPLKERNISVSMTINGPACVLLAMYSVVAKKKRAALRNLRGTIQNDILKEFIIQKETIVPHEASIKLFVDTVEFCMKHMPKWNPISISGYHMREGGATAVQELAFTLADGIAYVASCIERGLDVDEFAPRFSFFFDVHNNFFEEIAKLRAARRMWAHIMRDRFYAKNERSWKLRMHAQTAGVTLTSQQQDNNVARVTLQALAAVLGGTQSLHTDSKDEQESLPSEEAARTALRTQQVIAYESGVADVVDPLGGSYYVECLTDDIEGEAWKYIDRIEKMGGMVRAAQEGFPQAEIEQSAHEHARKVENKELIIVGVNKFQSEEKREIQFRENKETWEIQCARLAEFRTRRDSAEVLKVLDAVKRSAESDENVMPCIVSAVQIGATEGEIVQALKDVYGEYIEQ